jgi:predicted phosphodiesterase
MKILCVAVLLAASCQASDMWVELGPAQASGEGFTALARVIVASPNAACPELMLDGKPQIMTHWKSLGGFDGAVCQGVIPASAKAASINGRALPKVKRNPKKILVLGDTGCRIKAGSEDGPANPADWRMQDCNDATAWPFVTVAANAAKEKPDLVIHVGDYLYRESDCKGVKGCPGGPFGDHIATWRADFFTPAKPLLEAAPWIFVRGNHEDCKRAGNGWFSLLDTGTSNSTACVENAKPFVLTVGGMKYAVLDTSDAEDAAPAKPSPKFNAQVALFTGYLKDISGQGMAGGWILSHRPVWSIREGRNSIAILNAALEAAWKQAQPKDVGLLVAGHTHTFELIAFADSHPAQMVIGNGGTALAKAVTSYSKKDPVVTQNQIKSFDEDHEWGYSVFTGRAGKWKVAVENEKAHKDLTCKIEAEKAACKK